MRRSLEEGERKGKEKGSVRATILVLVQRSPPAPPREKGKKRRRGGKRLRRGGFCFKSWDCQEKRKKEREGAGSVALFSSKKCVSNSYFFPPFFNLYYQRRGKRKGSEYWVLSFSYFIFLFAVRRMRKEKKRKKEKEKRLPSVLGVPHFHLIPSSYLFH